MSGGEKPRSTASELITLTATVEAIDLDKRLVILKTPDSNTVTLKVDQRARNPPQVKVDDQVHVE